MVDYSSVFNQLLNEIRVISQRAEAPKKKTALTHLIEEMGETNFDHVKDVLRFGSEVKKSTRLDSHTSTAIRKILQTILIRAFEEEHRRILSLENETKKFAGLCQLKTDIQALNNAPIYQLEGPCQALYLTVSDDYERIKSARHLSLKHQKEEQALMGFEDHSLPFELANPSVGLSPVVEAKVTSVSEAALTIAAASGGFLYQGAVNSLYFLGSFLPKLPMDVPPIHLSEEALAALDVADLRETLDSNLDVASGIVTSSLSERDMTLKNTPLVLDAQHEQAHEGTSVVSTEDHVSAYLEDLDEDSSDDAPVVLRTQHKQAHEGTSVVSTEDDPKAIDNVAMLTPALVKPSEVSLIETYKDSFDNVLYEMQQVKDNRIVNLKVHLDFFRGQLFNKSEYRRVLPLIRQCLERAEKDFKHETGVLGYIQPLLDALRWIVSKVVGLFSSDLAKNIAKPHRPEAQTVFEELRLNQRFFGDRTTTKRGLLAEISAFYGPSQ